jgi:hypothetical protein
MVAQSPEEASAPDQADTTAIAVVNEVPAEQPSAEAESASAVSSLMAGSAVGLEPTASIVLRHPASVFVP